MAEPVTSSVTIDAPVERVIEVISDLENTDRWANEAQSAEVLDRQDDGRPSRIKVTLGAIGFSTAATYEVVYGPGSVTLTCVEGALIRESTIRYTASEDGGRTHLEMSSTMKVSVPVPEWGLKMAMRNSAEKNLESVKKDAEAG